MYSKKWIANVPATMVAVAVAASVLMHAVLTTAAAHESTVRPAAAAAAAGWGGDFTLQSFDGPVSLRQLRGKVVLLTFGFTSCADVCPATLWDLSKVFAELSARDLERVTALFASLDPGRDTPEVLRKYTALFHPNIIGVTAREEVLREVAKNYGVAFEREEDSDSTLGYAIYHTPGVFVIDPHGELQAGRIDLSAAPEKTAAAIRRLIHRSH